MAFAQGELLLYFQTSGSAVFAKHPKQRIHTPRNLDSPAKVGFVGEGEEFWTAVIG